MPTETEAAAAAASAAALAANGAGGGGSEPWFQAEAYTDDDRAYMANKGWDKIENAVAPPVLKSYRELERIMGGKANAVVLPKAGDDPKVLDEFFQKLGTPAKADDYKLPASFTPDKAQNVSKESLTAYQTIAHKARLTNDQFGAVITELEAVAAANEEKATTAYNGEVVRTAEKLKLEFGDTYGEQVARGNLAIRTLGITPEHRNAMSEAMGVEATTRMFMKIGGMLAEHKAVGLDNGGRPPESFVTDKAAAAAKISRIKMLAANATGPDADFKKALFDPGHPEHRNVTAQWRQWQATANSKG
jgi:hypothetical protein